MLAEEGGDPSFYSPDFRETLRTLGAQAHNWARWGRAFLLLGLILGLLGLAFFANVTMAAEDKADNQLEDRLPKGLRLPEAPLAWVALAIALMRFGYQLIQRSWELENKFLNLRVLADGAAYPETADKMAKVLEKEAARGTESRKMITKRRGPKPPAAPDR